MPSLVALQPPRRDVLAVAGILVVACLVALAWIALRPATPPKPRLDPVALDRLPARPEDIEAHGDAAKSVLAPDDARRRNAEVPFAPGKLDLARPFAFAGSSEDRTRALGCLAAAVLYEAGDDTVGQAAVAQVVLNRVRHAAFPATVCGVVYQGAERTTGCQFTFTCDGSLRRTMSPAAWGRARAVAEQALAGKVDAAVGLATHYHTDWVYPYWSPSLRKLARVGTHLFFGWPGDWGGPLGFARAYRGGEPAVATPATIPADGAASETDKLVTAGGQESAVPGLGGFQLVPARMPPGLEKTPTYGNRVKLVRPDGRAFGLLIDPDASEARLLRTAQSLCATPGFCAVQAWADEDDVPGAYPIPAGTRDTMVFEWVREGAVGIARFDCRRFPNTDPKSCLRAPSAP